jgi:ADP-L-glycero-D-manno-heptose 6-epimerase
MMKICVTGNRGFIGKALQVEFQRQDLVVLGIDTWIFQREPWQEKLKEYLDKINPDVIFHVGACSDTQLKDVKEMMKLNVESTFIIADWCKTQNVPLIYSSSASVEGNSGTPETLYAWSKYIGEKYVISSGGIALRYFNVYGSYEAHKGNMSSVAYQAYTKHKWGEKVMLFPKEPKRDFVYVTDVVEANLHAWSKYDSLKGNYYHVGSGQARTFEDVLNIMQIPFEYYEESKIPENYQFFTEANKDKFMEGWLPKYDLEKGLDEYKALLKITTIQL